MWPLIHVNLVGRRLCSRNQPTWNHLEGAALVRRASHGSKEAKKSEAGGRVATTAREAATAGNELGATPPDLPQAPYPSVSDIIQHRFENHCHHKQSYRAVSLLPAVESTPINIIIYGTGYLWQTLCQALTTCFCDRK